MASAFAELKRRSEALQNFQQAQQIYSDLTLDFGVEQCQRAIDFRSDRVLGSG